MDASVIPLNLQEYEEAALAVLPRMFFDYIAGGSGDQSTLRGNREAFGRWRLLPRVLRGIQNPSITTTVMGQEVSMPVLLAPAGFHGLVHPDAEVASARAAREAGTIMTFSTAANTPMEEAAREAGTWWFQLYIFRDREITRDLVRRAESAGASALVITVDTPLVGRREADERNRFTLPDGLTWGNLGQTIHAVMPNPEEGSSLGAYIARSWDQTLSWEHIDWLTSLTSLPVIPKGILSPEDAVLACEHGARGIIVSNHGGRQLDGAVASLDALPAVVEAVAGRADVLLDGGVRRGTDVIKALALGASAVMIGRPYLWGMAVDGALGARRVLDLLAAELRLDLALCGCARVSDISSDLVVPVGPLATRGTSTVRP